MYSDSKENALTSQIHPDTIKKIETTAHAKKQNPITIVNIMYTASDAVISLFVSFFFRCTFPYDVF